jgi:hypothetical protein
MNSDEIGIIELSKLIAGKLAIPEQQLIDLINTKLTPEEIAKSKDFNKDKISEIMKLLQSDEEITKFGDSLKNQGVKDNFEHLKKNLGKLQVLVLLKKIDKSTNCDDVLNTFIGIINNKVSIVNDIMEKKLDNKLVGGQVGGGRNGKEYIGKYIKYKLKYLRLKR